MCFLVCSFPIATPTSKQGKQDGDSIYTKYTRAPGPFTESRSCCLCLGIVWRDKYTFLRFYKIESPHAEATSCELHHPDPLLEGNTGLVRAVRAYLPRNPAHPKPRPLMACFLHPHCVAAVAEPALLRRDLRIRVQVLEGSIATTWSRP